MTVKEAVERAWPKHKAAAVEAKALLDSWCLEPLPRVPGMDTVLRLAVRIDCGRTVEEAAAKEYVYRWKLATDRWRVFGAPHALGR